MPSGHSHALKLQALGERPGWRRFRFETDFWAYAAGPSESPLGAVLLVHPWWGVNPFMTQLADRLAANGFVVSVPDY